jgi:single-stranded-DNA-specific exonuclease
MGFVFGPRVNAGGRVGRSDLGARLLATTDVMEAAGLARDLDRLNKERRAIEGMVLEAALADAERRGPRNGLVAAIGNDWHAGVIGIVASRLKDKYRRPSAVFAIDGAVAKASLRSISGVDLGRAVTEAVDAGLLINGGGHKMAAGLTVATDRLDELVDRLDRALAPEVAASTESVSLRIDGALAAAAIDETLYALIERAGPFGSGNPEPVFALPSLRIVHAAVVGENHVSCVGMDESGTRLRGIAFRALDSDLGQALLKKGSRLHLAGKLKANEWRGERKIELTIEDAATVA